MRRSPGPRPAWQAVDGIVLLDKPSGLTSNAALQRVRRLYGARKAGHTGSLDPLATGLLPLCFGEATKFAGNLLDADKAYSVRLAFGSRTDTGDADGRVMARSDRVAIPAADIVAVLPQFRGEQHQVPPMYSALKQGGRPLYALARAGQEVPRKPRVIRIHAIELADPDPGRPRLTVRCSKGTYIRALVEDLAAALGTLAHVVELRRTALGPFDGSAMVGCAGLLAAAEAGELGRWLLPVDAGLAAWERIDLPAAAAARLGAGQSLALALAQPGAPSGPRRVYGPGGRFLGVADLGTDGLLLPRRLCATSPGELPAGLSLEPGNE